MVGLKKELGNNSLTITILVSPNEREPVKSALGELGLEYPLPYDFQLFTTRGIVAVERKFFPDDLLASVRDGRLARECAAMRQNAPFRFVIIEGRGRYTRDGKLRVGRRKKPSAWTRAGVRNLTRSIRFVEGADIEYSDNIVDTVGILKELQRYFDNPTHVGLRTRPGFESDWPIPTYQERFIYWLQGCGPGISIIRARALANHFKNPMELMVASVEDLTEVSGIGKKLAPVIYNFLRGEL